MIIYYTLFIDNNKSKHDFYRGEDSIKKFCADLREHASEIINCERKEMLQLTKKRKYQITNEDSVTYATSNLMINLINS